MKTFAAALAGISRTFVAVLSGTVLGAMLYADGATEPDVTLKATQAYVKLLEAQLRVAQAELVACRKPTQDELRSLAEGVAKALDCKVEKVDLSSGVPRCAEGGGNERD